MGFNSGLKGLRVSRSFERWDVSSPLHSASSQNNRILYISDVETWSLPRHFTKNVIANRFTYHGKSFFAKFVDLLLSWSFHLIPNVRVNAVINYFSLYGTIWYQQKYLLATQNISSVRQFRTCNWDGMMFQGANCESFWYALLFANIAIEFT
jgi:hypothetical protein